MKKIIAIHPNKIMNPQLPIGLGLNLEAKQANGNTYLHYAAYFDDLVMMHLLINAGCMIEYNTYGSSPLHIAVERYSLGGVSLILNNFPQFVTQQRGDFMSPIHLAINSNNRDMTRLLHSRGGFIMTKSLDFLENDHVLKHAYEEQVTTSLSKGVFSDRFLQRMLYDAVCLGNERIVMFIVFQSQIETITYQDPFGFTAETISTRKSEELQQALKQITRSSESEDRGSDDDYFDFNF